MSWVQAYEPSRWVHLFSNLRVRQKVPASLETPGDWQQFALDGILAPVAVATVTFSLVGALISFVWRTRVRLNGKVAKHPWWLWIVAATLCAAVSCTGLLLSVDEIQNFQRHYITFEDTTFGELANGLVLVDTLNATGWEVVDDLEQASIACESSSWVSSAVAKALAAAEEQARAYASLVEQFDLEVTPVQGRFFQERSTLARMGFGSKGFVLRWSFWIPFFLCVTLTWCCHFMVVSDILLKARTGSIRIARFADRRWHWITTSSTAPVICLVGLLTAVQLLVGTTWAGVCINPDLVVFSTVGHHFGNNSTQLDMMHYYLRGEGENYADLKLAEAERHLDTLQHIVPAIAHAIEYACPPWSREKLLRDLDSVRSSLHAMRETISPENMYGQYAMARGMMCDDLMAGLGGLMLLQVLICFVSLPFLTLAVGCYFHTRVVASGCEDMPCGMICDMVAHECLVESDSSEGLTDSEAEFEVA